MNQTRRRNTDRKQHSKLRGQPKQKVDKRLGRRKPPDENNGRQRDCHHEPRSCPPKREEQKREGRVELSLDGYRPKSAVRTWRAEDVLHEKAIHPDGLDTWWTLP